MIEPEKKQLLFVNMEYAQNEINEPMVKQLSNLLKGNTKPYVYTLLLICEALSISITDLFAEKAEPLKEEEKIISSYRKISKKKKQMLSFYMEMLEQYEEKV